MLQKINLNNSINHGPLSILYPGSVIAGTTDTGIGSIGRIDHALIPGNQIIPMHPHVNDEILSYFIKGKGEHKDSEGFVEMIGGKRLMLMKAGKLFYHEEKIMANESPFEGLQIFIRPGKADLTPEVHFFELDNLYSENKWRLLASPSNHETKFQFSSQTWLYDCQLLNNAEIVLPKLPADTLTCLLYVFNGNVLINGEINLAKRESLIIKGEDITISAIETADLVLFVTDENAEIYKNGMFSGNKS